ncbi:hypothetical protein FB45DRAFT_870318 [Roridomyces roridus]|uniref:Uncharacterized protein n=1 Tax=Roridomyces roridus TaxID=1738132 RepID=A0AAD7BIS3_9AGAR|nr:hypothetical protein FB45DRAFT_870318 [Roridomyces roridus]
MQFKALSLIAALFTVVMAQVVDPEPCLVIRQGNVCPDGYAVCGPLSVSQTRARVGSARRCKSSENVEIIRIIISTTNGDFEPNGGGSSHPGDAYHTFGTILSRGRSAAIKFANLVRQLSGK